MTGLLSSTCDISKSCKTTKFAKTFPERHINVGIAEQNAGTLAAGLATMGKIPFISTYAVFGSLRMCEQVRTSACYPGLKRESGLQSRRVNSGKRLALPTKPIEDMGGLSKYSWYKPS